MDLESEKSQEKDDLVPSELKTTVLPRANSVNRKEGNERPKWRDVWPQLVAACVAHSIVIHVGVNMAYSAIMIPQLLLPNSTIPINQDSASWIASSVTISTPLGSLLAGPLMDWLGRRAACFITCVPMLLGYVLLFFAGSVWPIYTSRVLAGFGGGLSTAGLVYVSEVADPALRPMLLCLNSVFVSLGILLTSLFGLWMSWRGMAIAFAAMAAVSAALLWMLPESPHWLLNMAPAQGVENEKRAQGARAALRWLNRTPAYFDICWQRLVECSRATQVEGGGRGVDAGAGQPLLRRKSRRLYRSVRIFAQPATAKPLVLLSVLFLAQQFSGTYVIIFYAIPLFNEIGGRFGTAVDEFGVMVIMSGIRLVMSAVASGLSRRFGRRPLMMASALGMCLSALGAGLMLSAAPAGVPLSVPVTHPLAPAPTPAHPAAEGTTYPYASTTDSPASIFELGQVYDNNSLPLVCILLFVLASSVGFLVIPWTLMSELLPLESRGMGGGLMVCLAYLLMFGTVKSFPHVMEVLGPRNVFYMFSSVSLLGGAFVFFYLPETLGKNFKEIEQYFTPKKTRAISES